MKKSSRLYIDELRLVSVIIPMFNAEKYIKKCIDSICSQTYAAIEIIVVDDGSTDCSFEICEELGRKDSRIRIIRKNNGGLVSARKAGLKEAKGNFVYWIDADDWIEVDYIEKLVELQKESECDIVATAHYHDIDGGSVLVNNGLRSGVYNTSDILDKMLYMDEFYQYGIGPHLWAKLFRTAVLEPCQMEVSNEIVAGEDAAVTYPALIKAKKICVSDIAGYHYVQNPGSITKVRRADEKERVQVLIDYLQMVFEREGVMDIMRNQLGVYRNYLLALRDISIFDDDNADEILNPFGGIKRKERIMIYGAGVLGQQLVDYMKKQGVFIVDWLDRNFEFYQEKGLKVHNPERFDYLQKDYDYVLVANITQKTAMSIKYFLMEKGVAQEKILWFSKEFREEKE